MGKCNLLKSKLGSLMKVMILKVLAAVLREETVITKLLKWKIVTPNGMLRDGK